MKKITVQEFSYLSDFEPMSRSFKSKFVNALIMFLNLIVEEKYKANYLSYLDIDLGHHFSENFGDLPKYDISNKHLIHFSISTKGACILAQGMLYWRVLNDEESKSIFPWSNVSNTEIYFKVMPFNRFQINSINRFLKESYKYSCRASESGFAYDYEIRGDLSEGHLIFSFGQKPSSEQIHLIENTLMKWRCDYEQNHDNGLNYIGDFYTKNNRVYVYIDGVKGVDMLNECFSCFKDFDFIKRIIFKE